MCKCACVSVLLCACACEYACVFMMGSEVVRHILRVQNKQIEKIILFKCDVCFCSLQFSVNALILASI